MDNGWFFPIDTSDTAGTRPYTNDPFWTNASIQMQTFVGGSQTTTTTATVGQGYGFQITYVRPETWTGTATCTMVQVWVCYPNTIPSGLFNINAVVPSVRNSPASPTTGGVGGVLTSSIGAISAGSGGFLGIGGITITPSGPGYTAWVPSAADTMGVPLNDVESNGDVHACILVNSYGTNGVNIEVGQQNTALNDPSGVNANTQDTAGQLNIAIVGTASGGSHRRPVGGFGFLGGVGGERERERAPIDVAVTRVDQGAHIDPTILRYLKAGRYGGLPLKPSSTPPSLFGLTPNPHALQHRWLGQFFEEIEAEIKEFVEHIEDLLTGRPVPPHREPRKSISVTTPRSGIYPMLLQAHFDPNEPIGSVHVFDIIQTDQLTGKRGGIRVGMVVTG